MSNLFFGHNGNLLIKNKTCDVSKHFDWICCCRIIIKNKEIPRYIYIKTDYLERHFEEISQLTNKFILVSAASDCCIELSNKKLFNKYLEITNLQYWYGENMISINSKIRSLTVGLATHNLEYEKVLLEYAKQKNLGINEIFCCWRQSNNDYKDYREREQLTTIHNPLFSHYSQLSQEGFYNKLLEYKYTLCPLGNGLDAAPRLIECLFLGSVPIVKYNMNTWRLYKDYPVLFIDDWCEITEELLENKGNKLWRDLQCGEYKNYFLISNIITKIKGDLKE